MSEDTVSDSLNLFGHNSTATATRTVSSLPWTCRVCGTTGITGPSCPSCGCERTAGRASAASDLPMTGQPFFFRPKNQAFASGQAKKIAGNPTGLGVIVLLAGLFVASLVIFLGFAVPAWQGNEELDRRGVVTEGTVIDQRVSTSDEGGDTYYITYRFWANQAEQYYTREQFVSQSSYSDWPVDATVRVKYLPSEPTRSKVLGDSKEDTARVIGMVLSVALMVGTLILLILAVNRCLRNRKLFAKGQLLKGQVITCTSREDSDGDLWITLRYRFFTPEGYEIVKQQRRMANDLKDALLPRSSRPVLVLYLTDKVHKVL
jgi:hypothetical protein